MLGQDNSRVWARYFGFLAISMAIIVLNLYLSSIFSRQPSGDKGQAPPSVAKDDSRAKGERPPQVSETPGPGQVKTPEVSQKRQDSQKAANSTENADTLGGESPSSLPKPPLRYITLGSLESDGPYRMLVTLSSRGASVVSIEMSSLRYCDIEQPGGYLGEIVVDPRAGEDGVRVDVVGPGTPAAKAGLLPGDVIREIANQGVYDLRSMQAILARCRPGQTVSIRVRRGEKDVILEATLRRPPLKVIRREVGCPLSFEMALAAIDDQRLADIRTALEERMSEVKDPMEKELLYLQWLHSEIPDLGMRSENWHVLSDAADPRRPETWGESNAQAPPDVRESVRFGRYHDRLGLVVIKSYRLTKVPEEKRKDPDAPSYHFDMAIEVINLGKDVRKVAYELDGPNGLPTEGAWYARKMSNSWGAVGLRDVAVRVGNGPVQLVPCPAIVRNKWGAPWKDAEETITAIGVDAQYFSVIMVPKKSRVEDTWFDEARPIRVGAVEPNYEFLANVSCRVNSVPTVLQPGETFVHEYTVFAGPKRQTLLTAYGLHGLIQYGWFWFVADPMTKLLHLFYNYMVFNYGLAIILLTVLVRLAMFPISRKQALSAQKMQELQPEIKKIQEKYKDLQERNRATQELFRQHNYNPFSGCLVLFIQIPIFIGLYKALAIDVELRQAPLISESIRWCSNLAAPDMLFNWSAFWPEWFNRGQGMFGLGPYFNILPIVTIAIFLWQQKKMMPPPTDEQAAMQQKVMNFMMIFMGILFYKVPSGLCIYFIASSLWGMAERQILMKTTRTRRDSRPAARKSGQRWQRIKARLPQWFVDLLKAADKNQSEKLARRRATITK
ncbi:MAG: YidC/Oxa1 family insertase periplasmic-domain containing protein [Thermogutta sp.]